MWLTQNRDELAGGAIRTQDLKDLAARDANQLKNSKGKSASTKETKYGGIAASADTANDMVDNGSAIHGIEGVPRKGGGGVGGGILC